jgi:hypothetical protein
MTTPPSICSSVQGSVRTITASVIVTTTCIWITGPLRFAPALWLAQKKQ